MDLSSYRIEPTPFDRFHSAFVMNSLIGKKYRITLVDDKETYVGTPSSSYMVDDDPMFSFWMEDDLYAIPFSVLSEAEELNE